MLNEFLNEVKDATVFVWYLNEQGKLIYRYDTVYESDWIVVNWNETDFTDLNDILEWLDLYPSPKEYEELLTIQIDNRIVLKDLYEKLIKMNLL